MTLPCFNSHLSHPDPLPLTMCIPNSPVQDKETGTTTLEFLLPFLAVGSKKCLSSSLSLDSIALTIEIIHFQLVESIFFS
jgi:hypothetical protein